MPGEVRWEEETTHQGEKQGGQAQSFWSVASERVASVFEDMANRESGDISYIKSFLEKILDPDKRTSKRKSTKLNKPKDTSKEKEKGKEERRSQRLDESFSTTSLSSNETKHNENDESEDEESKSDERRKESSSDETDEERILARLPKGIPRMSESDWNFPTERLKIEKVIATPGQFSKIQLARYEGRKVCVKQVQVQDEVYAVMEITLLKYLEHEHVLGFLGAAREMVDGEPCIWAVTEFMEGGSVSDALKADLGRDKKKKPLLFDFKKRVRVALHAAQALEYVHSQGVIHRDVKSDNLLLTGRGDDLVCKLADFGFARGLFGKHELQQGADMTQGTLRRGRHHRAQTICGTDETMAPEMMLHSGDSPYTTAVDVFSFGCVLLELCSGQTLSKDFLPRLPQNNFAFDEEEVRSSAMASCPQSLLELAVHCIQPEPEDRLTPTECKEWLEELLADLDSGQVEYVGASRSNSGFLETVAIQDKVTSSPPPPKSCCLIM